MQDSEAPMALVIPREQLDHNWHKVEIAYKDKKKIKRKLWAKDSIEHIEDEEDTMKKFKYLALTGHPNEYGQWYAILLETFEKLMKMHQ